MVEWGYTKEPMKRSFAVCLFVVLGYLNPSVLPQTKSSGCKTSILTRDVIEDLHTNRPDQFAPNLLLNTSEAGIFFLNREKLIIYSIEPSGELSSRESPEISSAFRLRIKVFDIESAKIVLTKDLAIRPHEMAIQVARGRVFVRMGHLVNVFSGDFGEVNYLPLPDDKKSSLLLNVSPSGKTIMVNRTDQKLGVSHMYLFDSETLKMRESWQESPPLFRGYSISDKEIGAIDFNRHSSVVVAPFTDKKWRLWVDNSKNGCIAGGPAMVADGSLVARNCKDLMLIESPGTTHSLGAIDGRMSDKIAVAQDRGMVAVSLDNVAVRKHVFTEASSSIKATSISVYDVGRRKLVSSVNVDPLPKYDYDFALSPDGSKLAILNDRNVLIYFVDEECNGE
jgi:hypothetical protein